MFNEVRVALQFFKGYIWVSKWNWWPKKTNVWKLWIKFMSSRDFFLFWKLLGGVMWVTDTHVSSFWQSLPWFQSQRGSHYQEEIFPARDWILWISNALFYWKRSFLYFLHTLLLSYFKLITFSFLHTFTHAFINNLPLSERKWSLVNIYIFSSAALMKGTIYVSVKVSPGSSLPSTSCTTVTPLAPWYETLLRLHPS